MFGRELRMENRFQLGDWIIEPSLNRLSRNGHQLRLEPKIMQVLVCLAEAGEVVPKEKLMRTVWPDTYVTDDVLTRSISELRKAFSDDPKQPQFIQTIPKGGYRLLIPAVPVTARNGHPAQMAAAAPASAPATSASSPKSRAWIFVALALLALVGVAIVWIVARENRQSSATATNGKVMLAVLPFQNLSTDPDQEFFADGLSAEMISQLGRLPSDKINVIAWNSMIKYKGLKKSDDSIASELGANYILEGTVRRSGNHVRITAELVHVGDRSHMWANSYDGEMGDVLNLQSRLAREIAGDIRLSLTPQEEQEFAKTPTINGEGYEAYLRGKFPTGMNGPDGLRSNMEHLQRSIKLNPGYAPAYVSLAYVYRELTSFGWTPPQEIYPKMRALVDMALEKQPNSGEAHHELAWLEWRFNWNFQAADAEFKKAVQLDPSDALAHNEYGLFLKSMGRYGEALQEGRRALELSPLDPYGRTNLAALLALMGQTAPAMEQFRKLEISDPGLAYVHERFGQVCLWQQNFEDAVREFDLARQLSYDQPEKLAWLAYARARSGNREQALKLLDRLNHLPSGQYLSPFHMSLPYIALGDLGTAMDWLEKAGKARDEWLVYLKVYPEFDPLRSSPRFQSLIKRVGLD
jgi:TolB-like protein/DNA-binding winged helix-turn-helix (wHTH) protein/Tfp pilus assembly protein PilF